MRIYCDLDKVDGQRWTKVPDRPQYLRAPGEKPNAAKSLAEDIELIDNVNGFRFGNGYSCNPGNPKSEGIGGTLSLAYSCTLEVKPCSINQRSLSADPFGIFRVNLHQHNEQSCR